MDIFLDSIDSIKDIEKYHIVIAGAGTELKIALEKKGVSHTYLGYLNGGQALSRFYSSLDLLVNPSRAESFGLVNIEAMACGTPVVAFNIGPIPEIIKPEVGWIIEDVDAKKLAAEIDSIFSEREIIHEKANRCRKYVQERFSLKKMIEGYRRLYNTVAGQEEL